MRQNQRIGQLRERLTIEVPQRVSDGRGGHSTKGQYVPLATVWGAVEPIRARQEVNAQQVQGANLYTVTIRHRTDVTGACRLVWNGRSLYLYPVGEPYDPDGKRAWLEMTCEARRE